MDFIFYIIFFYVLARAAYHLFHYIALSFVARRTLGPVYNIENNNFLKDLIDKSQYIRDEGFFEYKDDENYIAIFSAPTYYSRFGVLCIRNNKMVKFRLKYNSETDKKMLERWESAFRNA